MTIGTLNEISAGLRRAKRFFADKATIANMGAGLLCSTWRATGVPTQPAIPGAAAVLSQATAGALNLNMAAVTGGMEHRLISMDVLAGTVPAQIALYDRLAHMGGLSGTVTTAQTVGVDVTGTTNGIDVRRGNADYSDVEWFVEIYTDIGTTGVAATFVGVDQDGGAAAFQAFTIGGASPANRAGKLQRILPAAPDTGFRSITSIQHATTATAGSYGVTAMRRLTPWLPLRVANEGILFPWDQVGLPPIADNACLQLVVACGGTSTGIVRGTLTIGEN